MNIIASGLRWELLYWRRKMVHWEGEGGKGMKPPLARLCRRQSTRRRCCMKHSFSLLHAWTGSYSASTICRLAALVLFGHQAAPYNGWSALWCLYMSWACCMACIALTTLYRLDQKYIKPNFDETWYSVSCKAWVPFIATVVATNMGIPQFNIMVHSPPKWRTILASCCLYCPLTIPWPISFLEYIWETTCWISTFRLPVRRPTFCSLHINVYQYSLVVSKPCYTEAVLGRPIDVLFD